LCRIIPIKSPALKEILKDKKYSRTFEMLLGLLLFAFSMPKSCH